MIFIRPLAAALVGALAWPAVAAAETVLLVNQFVPKTHFYHTQILEPWFAAVADATEGRVRIEVTPAPLAPMTRAFDVARMGVVDIGIAGHGSIGGRFGVTQITDLPFVTESAEAASVALWRLHEKYLHAANEHEGTHVLALHASTPVHIFLRDKEIHAAADLVGLKLRVPNQSMNDTMSRLGAVSIVRPVNEVYDLLSKGVIDGVLATNGGAHGFRAGPSLKYRLAIPGGLAGASFFIVINQDKWDSLEERDREAISSVSGEYYAVLAGKAYDTEDLNADTALNISSTVASGNLLDELREATSPVELDWLERAEKAGIPAKESLSFFMDQISTYRSDR